MIFLNPVLKETVWGGAKLAEYGYELPSDHVGEAWAISAHENGDCIIKNGQYKGKPLSWLWKNHRELFGGVMEPTDVFPLLTKIIDAKDDLSIQVHPDDVYAKEHENGSLGKMECWYVLDAKPDATIVIGHHATTKQQLVSWVTQGKWNELIREIPVKKGDFFQIAPGTLHAIKGGTTILETQQNSDITYRVYDYDRLQNGKLRELHIQQSLDVIRVPFESETNENSKVAQNGSSMQKRNGNKVGKDSVGQENRNSCFETLVSCERYQVWHSMIASKNGISICNNQPFLLISVIEGQGIVDEIPVKKGDHFIVTNDCKEFQASGDMEWIVSTISLS